MIAEMVGGPNDGETYFLPDGTTYWRVPLPVSIHMSLEESPSELNSMNILTCPVERTEGDSGFPRFKIRYDKGVV